MKNGSVFAVTINFSLLVKMFLIGALLAEIFILAYWGIGRRFTEVCGWNYWIIIVLGIVDLCMIALWILDRGYLNKNFDFYENIDVVIAVISGIAVMHYVGGMFVSFFRDKVTMDSVDELIVLLSIPTIFFLAVVAKKCLSKCKDSKAESRFLSDKAVECASEDVFGFKEQAKRFAEFVFDQGSSEGLVFGVDAPWGAGKSTFINFCKEEWEKNDEYKDSIIIYSFDPLKFENKDEVLRKFIEGFIKELNKHIFAPEIEGLVSKYAKLLKDSKAKVSFFGVVLDVPSLMGDESIDSIFKRLEQALLKIDKKIVVIIDDLDRLDFTAIKEVLFTIKKTFSLPNISYVICYDTENIIECGKKDTNAEKVMEFLEKFINVKKSIFLDKDELLRYFVKKLNDKNTTPEMAVDKNLIPNVEKALENIFSRNDFYKYLPLIGDVRKIKRFINSVLMLGVKMLELRGMDIDERELINLILIYINYPQIFRKIYETETQGRNGFFSLLSKYEYERRYPNQEKAKQDYKYRNSKEYEEFIEKLTETQKFILNEVFDRKEEEFDEVKVNSYACFNDIKWGYKSIGNLETYLNLIIKMSEPNKSEQYQFYLQCKNEILSEEKSIEEVLANSVFSNDEAAHDKFWRVLVNAHRQEFSRGKAEKIINYAVANLSKYSYFADGGLRNYLLLYIAKLLNNIGWIYETGTNFNNSFENTAVIARWIFGEAQYSGQGILNTMASNQPSVIGIYDLLNFRLICCATNKHEVFNISQALSKHERADAPIVGRADLIVIDEMRKMSQKIFGIFKEQFINTGHNVFKAIDDITIRDVSGSYREMVENNQGYSDKLAVLKSEMKLFIVWQLGYKEVSVGIGCGYYDVYGDKDKKMINQEVNNYLFDVCFNPTKGKDNYRHFLDFMLLLYRYIDGSALNVTDAAIWQMLDRNSLSSYWAANQEAIKNRIVEKDDKNILTVNGKSDYKDIFSKIYNFLDKLKA